MTAPAATTEFDYTDEPFLIVLPIPIKQLLSILHDSIYELGPIKTLSPISTFSSELFGKIVVKSWIIEFDPILIFDISPLTVVPYHIEDFYPKVTSPTTVAFGATKSAFYNFG